MPRIAHTRFNYAITDTESGRIFKFHTAEDASKHLGICKSTFYHLKKYGAFDMGIKTNGRNYIVKKINESVFEQVRKPNVIEAVVPHAPLTPEIPELPQAEPTN